jgi:hypothetical protein
MANRPSPKERQRWEYISAMRAETEDAEKSVVLGLSFRPRGKLIMTSDHPNPRELDKLLYEDVKLWAKRVRKRYPIRYCCVAEFGGEGGRLHYHVLVHGPSFMTTKWLRRCWKQGFTHTRNTRSHNHAAYVGKYVGKGPFRVRRSQGYGLNSWRKIHEELSARIGSLLDVFPEAEIQPVYDYSGPYKRALIPPHRLVKLEAERKQKRLSVLPDIHPDDRREMKCQGFKPTQVALNRYRKEQRQLYARAAYGGYL